MKISYTKKIKLTVFLFLTIFLSDLYSQDFPQKASEGGMIFTGRITSSEGSWSKDKSTIYTINWFKPEKTFDGDINIGSKGIPILTEGGRTEEGILAVTHTLSFHSSYNYALAVTPCKDCIDGITGYFPIAAVGSFNKEKYQKTIDELSEITRVGALHNFDPCDLSQRNPGMLLTNDELYLKFGNITIESIGNQINGHFNIEMKTNDVEKGIHNVEATLQYATSIFGSNAIAGNALTIEPINTELTENYDWSVSDLAENQANFSITHENDISEVLIVNTFYQPAIKISFIGDLQSFYGLTDYLNDIFQLLNVEASYYCAGVPESFDKIIFENLPTGIIAEDLVTHSKITYTFDNSVYNTDTEEFTTTIFVQSDTPTVLGSAYVVMDYDPEALFPYQVSNGHLNLNQTSGAILGENEHYSSHIEDLTSSKLLLRITGDQNQSLEFLETIDQTPKPLSTITFKVDRCSIPPKLFFDPIPMFGNSLYFQSETSKLPLVYTPMKASDKENTPMCIECAAPKITSWSPEKIVAGDNQVLTIIGTNFMDFERGDPSMNGDKSSVLFNNGDDHQQNDELIAAAVKDFEFGGIIKWTNEEIQVRVPSTHFLEGINNPASTGKFRVRNACNGEDDSSSRLKIPYALTNYRLSKEGVAKRLGLRNDNGFNGSQDGYEFEFHPNSTAPFMNFDAIEAFDEGLADWCEETEIKFKRKTAPAPFTAAVAGDGINLVSVGNLSSNPAAQAALLQSKSYFPIDCNGSNPNDLDGGFIMTDLDIIIDDAFATSGSQSRADRVFSHELGHAHMINHARCTTLLCGDVPLMHFQGPVSLRPTDALGGNRVFGDSQTIIDNGCGLNGNNIAPRVITQGECGSLVAINDLLLIDMEIFPNPTNNEITLRNLDDEYYYQVVNGTGQILLTGHTNRFESQIDVSVLPKGIYFLSISNEKNFGYHKIIKL